MTGIQFDQSSMNQIVSKAILESISTEQDEKWGADRNQPNGTPVADRGREQAAKRATDEAFRNGYGSWRLILDEEVCEAFSAPDPAALRVELVQVAAVAVAWIENLDRTAAGLVRGRSGQ